MKRFVFVAVFLSLALAEGVAGGWQLDLGAGAGFGNEYVGADETGISPIPAVELRRSGEAFDFFAGTLNGLGVSACFGDTGFYSSAGVDLGDSRESTGPLDPELTNYARGFAIAGWSRLFFSLEGETSYYPILRSGRLYNGVCVDPKLSLSYPLFGETFMPIFSAGTSFMNGDYASAWYDADVRGLGLRGVYGKFELVWQGFIPHVWLYAGYTVERLLGDAASGTHSPSDVSRKVSLFVAYRFKKR